MSLSARIGIATAALAVVAALLWLWKPQQTHAPTSAPELRKSAEGVTLESPALSAEPLGEARSQVVPESGLTELLYQGIVLGTDGHPIEGATLAVFPNVGSWQTLPALGRATSGEDGRFTVKVTQSNASDPLGIIQAKASGYGEVSQSTGLPDHEIRITLTSEVELYGTVTDSDTGAPLVGASVTGGGDSATTDEAGKYRLLPGLVVGLRYSVIATKDGYAREVTSVLIGDPAPARQDIRMRHGDVLRIELFDDRTGAAVVGVPVRDAQNQVLGTTRADGSFEMRVIDGSNLEWVLSAPEFVTVMWAWTAQNIARVGAVRIPMIGLGWVDGVVTDEAKTPLAGCIFDPLYDEMPIGWDLSSGLHGPDTRIGVLGYRRPTDSDRVTGSDGRFSVAVIPSMAPFFLEGGRKDFDSSREGPITITEPGHLKFNVTLQRGATIRGAAHFNGEPWSGGDVYYEDSTGKSGGFARFGAEGRYEMRGVPAGRITLKLRDRSARRRTLPTASLVVEAGKEYEQNFDWREELATITGRVINSRGMPIAGQSVSAVRRGDRERRRFRSQTAADGSFVLQVLPDGNYDVSAYRAPLGDEHSNVPAGADGIQLTLLDIGKLLVQFIDAASKEPVRPASREQRAIQWRMTGSSGFSSFPADVDHDGRVELGLPVGIVDVAIIRLAGEYLPREIDGIRVPAEWSGPPFVIELRRGAAANLSFASDEQVDVLRGHVLFLLHESQVANVTSPSDAEAEKSESHELKYSVSGLGVEDQQLVFDGSGAASLRALLPGRQVLKCIPDDLVFDPPGFELAAPATGDATAVKILIRWRSK